MKLEYLAAATVGIMNAIFRPADYLPEVVGSRRKAVMAAWKWGKSSHLVVSPNEPEVDIADVVRRTVERRATPSLPERLRVGGLRNTHDDALSILYVPCDTAVRSPKCAEVGEYTASPQRSVPVSIRESGIACRPALVVDAISPATRATKIGKGRHRVLRVCLYCFRLLCMHRRECRTEANSDQNNEKSLASSFGCELCCHICLLC